ncbi:hypothetical protein DFP72DRAFT_1127660 [Ephemerocybe angulata]|uniref:Uncharacterized protein n=1 Tax=Ephemerocybe angulata TaxID=980116 RepID=A0A8H6HX50_9AGAR|nr:hypothetical protein DFP72DRAFT_1127660 [Tulosesus angulatus]
MPIPITSAKQASDFLQNNYSIGAGPAKESYQKLYATRSTSKLRGDMPKLHKDLHYLSEVLEGDDRWLTFEHLGPKLSKLHGFLHLVNNRTPSGTEPLIKKDLLERVGELAQRALELKNKYGDGSYADPGADSEDDAPLVRRGTKRSSQGEDSSPKKGRVLSSSDKDWRVSVSDMPTEEVFRRAREYVANTGRSSGPEAVAYNAAIALRTQMDSFDAQIDTISAVRAKLATDYKLRVADLRSFMSNRPSVFPKFTKTPTIPAPVEDPKDVDSKPSSSSRSPVRGARMTTGPGPSKVTRTTRSSSAKAAKAAQASEEVKEAPASDTKGKEREADPADEDVDMLDDEPVGNWAEEYEKDRERRAAKSEGEEGDAEDEESVAKGHHSS